MDLDQNIGTSENKLQHLLKNKWVWAIAGMIVILMVVILLQPLINQNGQTTQQTIVSNPTSTQQQVTETNPGANAPIAQTTFTPEQQKAIVEQSQTDKEVGDREIKIRTDYPWLIKLPLRGEKYFVYFEPNKAVFTGLLYPKAGDDPESFKTEIKNRLRDEINIADVDQYTFEWEVKPE